MTIGCVGLLLNNGLKVKKGKVLNMMKEQLTKQSVLDYLKSDRNESKRKMAEDFSVSTPTLNRNLKKMGIVYQDYDKKVKTSALEDAIIKVVNQDKYTTKDLISIFPQVTRAQMVATKNKLVRNHLLNEDNLITGRKGIPAKDLAPQLEELLAKDPNYTLQGLADATNSSRPTVKKELHRLIDEGKISYDFLPRGRRSEKLDYDEVTDYLVEVGKPMYIGDIASHFDVEVPAIEEYFRATGTIDWKPESQGRKNKLDGTNFKKYVDAGLSVSAIKDKLAEDGVNVTIQTIYKQFHEMGIPTPKQGNRNQKATVKPTTTETKVVKGKKLNNNEAEVLAMVRKHPADTQAELADRLGMKDYQVRYYMKRLRDRKVFTRKDKMMRKVAKVYAQHPTMKKQDMAKKVGIQYPALHRYLVELDQMKDDN